MFTDEAISFQFKLAQTKSPGPESIVLQQLSAPGWEDIMTLWFRGNQARGSGTTKLKVGTSAIRCKLVGQQSVSFSDALLVDVREPPSILTLMYMGGSFLPAPGTPDGPPDDEGDLAAAIVTVNVGIFQRKGISPRFVEDLVIN